VQIIIGGGDDGFNIGGPEHRETVILSLALGHHRHPRHHHRASIAKKLNWWYGNNTSK